jgi:hypothetical protein
MLKNHGGKPLRKQKTRGDSANSAPVSLDLSSMNTAWNPQKGEFIFKKGVERYSELSETVVL